MKRRYRVYCAGPIRKGDLLHNIRQADEAMGALMRAGFAPFNPMLSVYAGGISPPYPPATVPFAYADPLAKLAGVTADDWLNMDLAWVEVSDAVLRLPGSSVGADGEVAHAQKIGVPVFYAGCGRTLEEVIQSIASHLEVSARG